METFTKVALAYVFSGVFAEGKLCRYSMFIKNILGSISLAGLWAYMHVHVFSLSILDIGHRFKTDLFSDFYFMVTVNTRLHLQCMATPSPVVLLSIEVNIMHTDFQGKMCSTTCNIIDEHVIYIFCIMQLITIL